MRDESARSSEETSSGTVTKWYGAGPRQDHISPVNSNCTFKSIGMSRSGEGIGHKGQHDIAGFLGGVDVAGGFDDLLEGVRAVDDDAELAGFDELLQEQDALLGVTHHRGLHSLVTNAGGPQRVDRVLRSIGWQEEAALFQ